MDLIPVYQLSWNDGTSRSTDTLDNLGQLGYESAEAAVESLAEMGRADDSCEVTHTGYMNL